MEYFAVLCVTILVLFMCFIYYNMHKSYKEMCKTLDWLEEEFKK